MEKGGWNRIITICEASDHANDRLEKYKEDASSSRKGSSQSNNAIIKAVVTCMKCNTQVQCSGGDNGEPMEVDEPQQLGFLGSRNM